MKNHSSKMIQSLLSGFDKLIPRKHKLPICEGILITPKGFQGTNLEAFLQTEYPGFIDTPETGFVVDFRLLMDTLKQIKGIFQTEVETKTETDGETMEPETFAFALILKTDSREFRIPIMYPGEEFPWIEDFTPEYKMTIPVISGHIPFASTEEYKPAMNGIYIEPGTISATDAHVLRTELYDHGNNPDNPGILIPLSVHTFLKENRIVEYNSEYCRVYLPCRTTLIFKLINERFPDFRNVIPRENPNHFRFNRMQLIRELDSAMLYGNKNTFATRFKFSDNQTEISCEEIDDSTEYRGTLPSEMISGEPMEIGFNAKFLKKLLMTMEEETVTLEMSAPNRACLIKNGDSTLLIMPVQLNEYA